MITIRNRQRVASSDTVFQASESGIRIDMEDYFADTLVRELRFSPSAIAAIDEWICVPTVQAGEPPRDIHEKGGILLGAYHEADGLFTTYVHAFAPVEDVLEQSNVIWKVGAGVSSAVLKASDEVGDLLVVGWLHTHPGHGPYLSMIDLEQAHIFFPHAYQVAIVVDPLTQNFDTGIFTRQSGGRMNNIKNQRKTIHWKDWSVGDKTTHA